MNVIPYRFETGMGFLLVFSLLGISHFFPIVAALLRVQGAMFCLGENLFFLMSILKTIFHCSLDRLGIA
ncbi:hypothetical protein V6N13_047723 [Hibiscus sabdariffa]|uniref:Uncharacterized protein n=1 Tax=Hibiscus sabdariffa TaxID=183260 RepID=A0ABR2F511_9ROSI